MTNAFTNAPSQTHRHKRTGTNAPAPENHGRVNAQLTPAPRRAAPRPTAAVRLCGLPNGAVANDRRQPNTLAIQDLGGSGLQQRERCEQAMNALFRVSSTSSP